MLPKIIAVKKAELINNGTIYIPKSFALPYYPSRSTAGPGAGKPGIVLGFNGTRVKLSIVRDEKSTFSLVRNTNLNKDDAEIKRCVQGKSYQILKNGELFLDEVSLEPTLMHAPNQAFINITDNCIFDCSFCVTPDLDKKGKKCSLERWIDLILAHANNSKLEAVAITSGVAESPHKTVLDMVKIIKAVREKLPAMPIGVEPYVTSKKDVELLHKAGATEIKINLETPSRDIFTKVCPEMDYDGIHDALEFAVPIFGRNKVCTNLILGLGESDDEVVRAVEDLAKDGIVATLRALRLNKYNIPKLTVALGFTPEQVPPERMLRLAKKQKEILNRNNLSTVEFKTMCHRCKCCDIVPQQDI